MILHEKTTNEFGYFWDTCKVYDKFYCICDYCNKEFLRSKRNILSARKTNKQSCNSNSCAKLKREETSLILYGVKNAGGTEESQKKARETWKYNLGVENPMFLQEIKDKIVDTCLEKYGHTSYLTTQGCIEKRKKYIKEHLDEINNKIKDVMFQKYGKHYSQTDEAKQKFKDTCQEKYGVENPMQLQETKNKVKNTTKEKYNVEHALQNADLLNKMHETMTSKYGLPHSMQIEQFKDKSKQTSLEKYGTEYPAQSKGVLNKILNTRIEKYGTLCPVNLHKTEKDIKHWLGECGLVFNPILLNHKEIDLYNEELKIGIEYCGLYWHNETSPEPRLTNYHYNKYKECLDKNIKLLTIFEDEWLEKEDICKSIIKSKLGIFEKRIFARKCEIREVSVKDKGNFLNLYHLRGTAPVKISLGLYYENEFIALMSLGNHHRQNKLVLNRLCFKSGYQVIGGASKLFKQCVNWAKENNYKEIISWSDNRWSNGDIYKELKFFLQTESKPDYSYVKNKKRISKQNCKKGKGFSRIWDCGKKSWIFKID